MNRNSKTTLGSKTSRHLRQSTNLVLIHFDALFPSEKLLRSPEPSNDEFCEVFDQVQWYCHWLRDRAGALYALVPHYLESHGEVIARHLGISPIFYTDELDLRLPDTLRGISAVWLINGNDLPLIDWKSAREQLHRDVSDVIVFGRRGFNADGHYPETVIVDDADRVIRFRRHYNDSPSFADRWGGQASFFVATPQFGQSVANHVVARGWGLESIGAMTRRFRLRWASDPCVQTAFDQADASVEYVGGAQAAFDASPHRLERLISLFDWAVPTAESDEVEILPSTARMNLVRSRLDLSPALTNVHAAALTGFSKENGHSPASRPASILLDEFEEPTVSGDDVYLILKRSMDLAASSLALVVLSPLLLTIALLVKLTSRGPVLFGHKRQGLGGREFRCWKFRSMKIGAHKLQDTLRELNEVDGPQFKLTDDPRLTRIGKWLRNTNIDELPQLLNVLMGSMSLVGPRPSPDNENQMCPGWRRARLLVKPGISGLWQVLRLRNDPSADFQEWIYYDIEYAKHRSMWLDLQIILHTPFAIMLPATLPAFAAKLERLGICSHSRQRRRNRGPLEPAATAIN